MMSSRKLALLLAVLAVLSLLAACGGAVQTEDTTVVETVAVEEETAAQPEEAEAQPEEAEAQPAEAETDRITLDTITGTEPPTIDPALATDSTSIFFIRQMFVGLTGFDEDAQIVPYLATEWNVSEDGLVWTYTLRDDIHWVKRNADSGEFEDLGVVTAQDVVYGVTRTLDPATASDYAYVLYLLAGAEEFNTADPEAENFEELRSNVGVRAVDDTTVEFTLNAPAAYFPSITGLWITFPQPQAAIEAGETWTEAGQIVTNGPYTLQSWTHGSEIWLEKNPLWVNADDVQIELVGGPIIAEESTAMALYENNEIDMLASPPGWGPPLPDMDRIKGDAQLSEELFIAPQLCTYYYGFVTTKPPFDDPLVRKAFAAAIDRQSLVENVTKGEQVPAHSFAPPGVFGNVAENMDIGSFMVQANYADQVTQAQEWLAEAGYPEGEGLDVILAHNTSEAHAQIAQAVQAMWQEAFPQAVISIENQEWAVYLETLDPGAPDEEKPHIYRQGWCADYPDSNNWLNEVFHSKSGQNYAKFFNPEFDQLVEEAALETAPDARQEMYAQAETLLVDDVTAIAPIYYYTYVRLYKPWITPVISPVSGDPIAQWQIDWDAKQAARGQ